MFDTSHLHRVAIAAAHEKEAAGEWCRFILINQS
jgi:hypothetical protein